MRSTHFNASLSSCLFALDLFAREINNYWGGDKVEDSAMLKAIENLAKTYNFKNSKVVTL